MQTITKKALKTVLYTMLTCPCPVTEATEKAFFKHYHESQGDVLDFQGVFDVADKNPDYTPVHLFRNFYVDGLEDFREFAMEQRDVLRYFASRYHYGRSVEHYDPLRHHMNASAYLLSHTLIPVEFSPTSRVVAAEWNYKDGSIRFENNVLFPGLVEEASEECISEEGKYWGALHLGGIVTLLNAEEVDSMNRRLCDMENFMVMARELDVVDSSKLYKGTNHTTDILERAGRHMAM